jgi:NADH-quinone oxidoreductase subunit A
MSEYWPFLLYALLVFLIAAGMIVVSYFLGERHKDKAAGQPYESGIPATGDARIRLTSQFYIIAMFFVIFDLDVAFIIAWAIAFREVGWAGYVGISVFIGILLAILIYEWRIGALNYGPVGKRIIKHMHKKMKSE